MYDEYEVAIGELKTKFGLQADPFSADLSVFYAGALRQHLLDNTKHLAIFGDMVLVMTGEHGSGKSTMLDQLEEIASDELKVVRIDGDSTTNGLSVIERLAELSGVGFTPGEPERDVLEHVLDQFAVGYAKHGKRTLIAIDDAHNLSDESLNEFVSIMSALEPSSGTSLLMTGPASLYSRAAEYDHPERNDWLFELALKPLAADEISEYLEARMRAAGFQGEHLIDFSVAESLLEKSHGIIADVNEYFLLHSLEVSYSVRNDGAQRSTQYVLYGIMAILLLSLVFVSYQHGLFEADVVSTDDRLMSVPLDLEQNSETDEEKVSRAERLKMLDAAIAKAEKEEAQQPTEIISEEISASDLSSPDSSVQAANTESEIIANEIKESASTIQNAGLVENTESSITEQEIIEPAVNTPETAVVTSSLPAQEVASVADPIEKKPVEVAPTKVVEKVAVEKVEVAPPVKENKAAEKTAPKIQASQSETGLKRSARWLADQPTSAYTAQLLGSYNEQTAINFTRKLQGKGIDAVYIESTYKGKLWYVVIYGVHETKLAAKRAVDSAPKEVKRINPWVRSMSGVKASVGLE